jgi:hypothetical protein
VRIRSLSGCSNTTVRRAARASGSIGAIGCIRLFCASVPYAVNPFVRCHAPVAS